MTNSGTTWNSMRPDQPRVCAGCGERIVLKYGPLMFITSDPPSSWHVACRPQTTWRSDHPLAFTDTDRELWAAYRERRAKRRTKPSTAVSNLSAGAAGKAGLA